MLFALWMNEYINAFVFVFVLKCVWLLVDRQIQNENKEPIARVLMMMFLDPVGLSHSKFDMRSMLMVAARVITPKRFRLRNKSYLFNHKLSMDYRWITN